jgi:hypothetical protein
MTAEPPRPDESSRQTDGEANTTIPDEVFDKLLADSESAIRASAPKEPSARARMVAERLRREDEAAGRAKGWKGRKNKRPQPDPWRAAPNVIPSRRRGFPNWARNTLAALVAAGVAAVALNPSGALSLVRGGSSGGPGSHSAPLPAETGAPSSAPPTGPTGLASFDHPFAGSPAEQWAEGADAITLPTARPVGAMSRDQVAAALQSTKDYLIATNLDPQVLSGGFPQRALDAIDPLESDTRDRFEAAFRSPSNDNNPLSYATRYNPRELKPVGTVVKARGQMTFAEDQYGSVLVSADYTFVYAFTKADGSTDQVVRVIMRREVGMRVADPSRVRVTAGKLWLVRDDSNFGNSGCDVHDGYVHPGFAFAQPSGGTPTGSVVDPYDRSHPLPKGTGVCREDSRT